MAKALDVAAYLIWKAAQDRTEMTHLKLQKLCYYAQGYSLALYPESSFDDEIEVWDLGPIVPEVWEQYHQYRRESIPSPDTEPEIDVWRRKLLDGIFERFGWMSLWDIRNRTYDEEPWREAWYSIEQCQTIDRTVMRDYLRGQVRGTIRREYPVVIQRVTPKMLKEDPELRERLEMAREHIKRYPDEKWDKWE